MANPLRLYLTCIRNTLEAAMCLQVSMMEKDFYLGRILTGRVSSGLIRIGDRVHGLRKTDSGVEKIEEGKFQDDPDFQSSTLCCLLSGDNMHVSGSYSEDGFNSLPNALSELVDAGCDGSYALSALGGALFYPKHTFLDETLLRFAKFELLPCSGFSDVGQNVWRYLKIAKMETLQGNLVMFRYTIPCQYL